MAETKPTADPPTPPEGNVDDVVKVNEDDRRAAAAAVNRKRAEKEWEENKKRWRAMGVPKALPAKK